MSEENIELEPQTETSDYEKLKSDYQQLQRDYSKLRFAAREFIEHNAKFNSHEAGIFELREYGRKLNDLLALVL